MTELRGGSSRAVHTGEKGIAKKKKNQKTNSNLESLVLMAREGGTAEELICRIYGSAVPSCIDSQISEEQNLPQNTLTKARVPDHILISQLMPGCRKITLHSLDLCLVTSSLLQANLASSPQS